MLKAIPQFEHGVLPAAVTSQPAVKNSEVKRFPTEGTTDIFTRITPLQTDDSQGPAFPSLTGKMLPALDALEKTVKVLGKKPSPEELDRSNIRRIIRSVMPFVEAHQDSYGEKKYKNSVKGLKRMARAVGRFKDFYILEAELEKIHPNGLPKKMRKKLDKEFKQREAAFQDAYKRFRKEDLPYALKALGQPRRLEHLGSPREVLEMDRRLMGNRISELVDKVDQVGLGRSDPEEFHEGRKALRAVLIAAQGTRDLFDFPNDCVDQASKIVNGLGVAQDSYIGYEWCRDHGFETEATQLKANYDQRHHAELEACRQYQGLGDFRRAVAR